MRTCEKAANSQTGGIHGHAVEVLGAYSGLVGGGQAILRDSKAKVNYGASSPRKDGAAIPEPDPYFGGR